MIERFWLVWNENKDRCDFPTIKHPSLISARIEAERLAEIHKGQSFSILELKASVKTINVQWDSPDDIPF